MNIFENFNVDPLIDYPELYFEDTSLELYEALQEDAEGKADANVTPKEGVISKLIRMIKKLIGWIVKAFQKVIDFIKNLFNKEKQSMDEIAKEMGLDNKASSKQTTAKPVSKPKSNKEYIAKDIEKDKQNVGISVKVNIVDNGTNGMTTTQ